MIEIPADKILVGWASREIMDYILYSPIAKVITIPGELLASYKNSHVPLVWDNLEFKVTLTPEQAWNIAIDQIGQWDNGKDTIWIRSDYWDNGEIYYLTPLGEELLNSLTIRPNDNSD